MSFARDFHICACGHERREHSSNLKTRCLYLPCGCQKFQLRSNKKQTKKSADAEMLRRAEILSLLTTAPRKLDWLMKRFDRSRSTIMTDISTLRRGRVIDTVRAGNTTIYELVKE